MEVQESLGQRIAYLRKQRSLTQEDVAVRLGVSAQAVSKWENDMTCPDISLLPDLADLLEVTVDVLLRGEQKPETYMLSEMQRKPLSEMLLKITLDSDDGDKLRVNLPMALLKSLLESGVGMDSFIKVSADGSSTGKIDPSAIDWEGVLRLAEKGVVGKLVEFDAEGTQVSVWVE